MKPSLRWALAAAFTAAVVTLPLMLLEDPTP